MASSYDDLARRWVERALHPEKGLPALTSRHNRMIDRGDAIFSYGAHFEIARILRDRKGQPTGWLVNGDTYSNTTNRHQAVVRAALRSESRGLAAGGLPAVTIPHQALFAAGVDMSTVQIVDRQPDWWSEKVTRRDTMPGRWEYDPRTYDDRGGWRNSRTGEIVMREVWGGRAPSIECDCEITLPGPWRVGFAGEVYNWEHWKALRAAQEVHERARHGVWEEFSASTRSTGRKSVVSHKYMLWDIVDDPTAPNGVAYERVTRRHHLGGSLIRAQVPYEIRVKHEDCGGTGVSAEPWFTLAHVPSGGFVSGPLTKEQMEVAEAHHTWKVERRGHDEPFGWPYELSAFRERTECRGCGGSGRVGATRRRWAYFLSGFDANEARLSYFFCELPPKVRPNTVTEALEALKPSAVKIAEQIGRDVKRQGDIFAIPMPGTTLRELKQKGARVEKRGNLLGTNHVATEVAYVGNQTWARGTISHAPANRRPDHARLTIGREWHLIQKNTVPTT